LNTKDTIPYLSLKMFAETFTASRSDSFLMFGRERCPFCNCPLDNYSYAGQGKHLSACRSRAWRYRHTGNPPGRPRKHFPIRTPERQGDIEEERREHLEAVFE